MQPSVSGITGEQMIGAVMGCGVVVAVVYYFLWFRERRKAERYERPPQEQKILRPAGFHAMCKVEELSEKLSLALLEGLGSGLVFGMVVGALWPAVWGLAVGRFGFGQLWRAPRSDVLPVMMLLAVLALLFSIHGLQRVWRILNELRTWRFGLRGEQAVAEKLASRKVAAAGYTVFHDLPAEGGGK
ncbi:MAG: hypothetical protein ACREIC_25195, partial [Limisphaerales bacterium]